MGYYSRGFEGRHASEEWKPEGREKEWGYGSGGGYEGIIESFGGIQARWDEDDYQGSTMAIVKSGDGHYGLVEFGWGSCSGCDSLEACESWDDYLELRKQIGSNVEWFAKKAELRIHVAKSDIEGRFWGEEKAAQIREMIEIWHPGTIADMEESLNQ